MRHLTALLIRPWSPRRRRGLRQVAAINLAILATVLGLYGAGWLESLELSLMDQRFKLIRSQASGGLTIVQIDGKSIQEGGAWPWSRDRYAALLDQLFEAGAIAVALDIDLSSASSLQGDDDLADALRRHGGRVILAAFHQLGTPGESKGTLIDVRPLDIFAENAAVAGVNIDADADGAVRRYPVRQFDGGSYRPSMGALLAGNAWFDYPFFFIDYGIDPGSIPRLSLADVLAGSFDAEAVRGGKVIVGATALELGDYVAVPVYRSLSGVTLQAMAYESLTQGRALRRSGPAITITVLLLLAVVAAASEPRWSWRFAVAVALGVSLALLGLSLLVQLLWPLSLDVTPWLALIALYGGVRSVREIEMQAAQIFKQRMTGAYRRALMAQVVEHSFDGIVITDSLGRVELFNTAAADILGLDPGAFQGTPLARLQPAFASFLEGDDAAVSGKPRQVALEDAAGSSRIVDLQVSRASLQISRHPRERRRRNRLVTVLTFRDVSDRVRALQAERAATEQAILANRAKTEFLANMSHELRTPLNAVIGFSEMIAEEMLGPVQPPAYRGYARDINASGLHLLKMVDEILEVAKIEAGKVELSEQVFPLAGLVEGCAGAVRGLFTDRDQRLVLHMPEDLPYLRADERLLKQALLNLLSNAFKFSPDGGDVVVAVDLRPEGWAVISVCDQGIGIPEDRLADVTKPFYQVQQALSRGHEGAGLGLHIASTYAGMHGGRIGIESTLGAGTTVRLWLPPDRLLPAPAPADGA